jgi:hypothetical protein
MTDASKPAPADSKAAGGEPRRTPLRRILDENPEARPRVGKAIAALLGTGLVTLAVLGALLMWHIMRRGRLIRERLGPPRVVPPLQPPEREVDPAP